MKYARMGVGLAVIAVMASACGSSSSPSPAASGGGGGGGGATIDVKVGIELPMTGGEAPNGVPTANGVALALDQIKVPGFNITINQQDDALNGKHDPQTGAKNMQTLANDPQVLFVVGPYNSNVGQAEIPVSNAAGLMQCSPANTNPGLTKTWGGVDPKTLRPQNPDKIAYVRTATTDDLQGAAGADIAYNIVKATTAYLADDTQTYGVGLSDVFAEDYAKLGGNVLKRDGIPDSTTDFTSYVTKVKGLNPGYVYYGGVTTSGIGLFRAEMAQQGLTNIPLGGGDGIVDGDAATKSSFLQIAGAGDENTYGTIAGPHDIASDASPSQADLKSTYEAKYAGTQNPEPGAYTAAAYACTQVFLQALQAVGSTTTDLAALREAVRAYVADPSHTYNTALGSFSFDKAGDTSQKIISYYKYDPSTKGWGFLQQRDFSKNPLQ
jgi:branched-chain amino acid transport system substrate-binding protein